MDDTQCHAYRTTGERCTDLAGHDGQHSHVIQWTNAECWTPEMAAATMIETKHLIEQAPVQEKPSRCFMCEHPWHDTECTVMNDGMECGCTTAVA